MIRRIQVLNYRCLRYVDVVLDRFHVLVGTSGSGKSTLLDAVALLSDLVCEGPETAVRKRADQFRDLAWGRPGDSPRFEVAAEFEIPRHIRRKFRGAGNFQRFRYEVALNDAGDGPGIEFERGILMAVAAEDTSPQDSLFTDPPPPPPSIPSESRRRGSKTVFSKSGKGNDSYNVEPAGQEGKGWSVRIALGPRRSTLANLPESPGSFPAATYIRDLLSRHVHCVEFDPEGLRRPSPPGQQGESLEPDGSNLASAVNCFLETDDKGFRQWIAELQSALPGFEDILVTERRSDRQACLAIRESTGLELPLGAVSDSALRLAAISLFPRLPATRGIWLVRNELDGLDSASARTAFASLSRASRAQVLVATRFPMSASNVNASQRLDCTRDVAGAAVIVRGDSPAATETAD